MNIILHKFNITYTGNRFHTMYAKLTDDRYSKTTMVNWEIDSTFIDIQEYSSALAHIMLRGN